MLSVREKDVSDKSIFKRFDADSWDAVKKRVSYKVINQKLVDEDMLHCDILDLSIVPIISELSQDRKNMIVYNIKQSDLDEYHISFQELCNQAAQNIAKDKNKRVLKPNTHVLIHETMYPIMQLPPQAMFQNNHTNAFIGEYEEDSSAENIIVVTDKYENNGSAYLFDWETMSNISDRMDDSFYIIPLSTSTLLCVSSRYATRDGEKTKYEAEDDLLDMLFKVNQENRNESTILSYRIYYYDKNNSTKLRSIKQEL